MRLPEGRVVIPGAPYTITSFKEHPEPAAEGALRPRAGGGRSTLNYAHPGKFVGLLPIVAQLPKHLPVVLAMEGSVSLGGQGGLA